MSNSLAYARRIKRIAVIGGGITGIAAALRIRHLLPECRLFLLEGEPRLGGLLHTSHEQGYLIENSADNFITNVPWGLDFCQRIGFGDQLIPTNEEHRKALVVRRGKLYEVPAGFTLMAPARILPILKTPILSPLGKLRLACERFIPRRKNGDEESLAQFVRRRLGNEVFDRLVQPLVGGIYTADPEKLSVAATMPRFLEMEQRYGSLTAGMKNQGNDQKHSSTARGARYGMFVAPRDGMTSLVQHAAEQLPEGVAQLGCRVTFLAQTPSGQWRVSQQHRGSSSTQLYDGIILATSAPAAAELLERVSPPLGQELCHIQHASTAVVCLGYRREDISHPLDGFGFVVPAIEKRRILSASFSSIKFPGRAPGGHVLIRVFLGGACQAEMLELDDQQLLRVAREELGELIGARGDGEFARVIRWRDVMPQYHLAHRSKAEKLVSGVSELPSPIELAGNAYTGVGVPNCIHSGELAAERLCCRLQTCASP